MPRRYIHRPAPGGPLEAVIIEARRRQMLAEAQRSIDEASGRVRSIGKQPFLFNTRGRSIIGIPKSAPAWKQRWCPKCGAPPGTHCWGKDGRTSRISHKVRCRR